MNSCRRQEEAHNELCPALGADRHAHWVVGVATLALRVVALTDRTAWVTISSAPLRAVLPLITRFPPTRGAIAYQVVGLTSH